MSSAVDITTRFAIALDEEDYASAIGLIDEACVYTINDHTFRGPEAIVTSYKGNGDAAAVKFDKITYGSSVREGTDGWVIITFSDHIRHAGRAIDHYCEQWVRVHDDRITRIEHRDLPGERERLQAFKDSISD